MKQILTSLSVFQSHKEVIFVSFVKKCTKQQKLAVSVSSIRSKIYLSFTPFKIKFLTFYFACYVLYRDYLYMEFAMESDIYSALYLR